MAKSKSPVVIESHEPPEFDAKAYDKENNTITVTIGERNFIFGPDEAKDLKQAKAKADAIIKAEKERADAS